MLKNNIKYNKLEKSYAIKWSYITFIMLIMVSIYYLYIFITKDLEKHIDLWNKIETANEYFYNKEYKKYIIMCETYLKDLRGEKEIEVKLAKANLALSKINFNYFISGMKLLREIKLHSTRCSRFRPKEFRVFVPDKYKEKFDSYYK